MSAVRQPGRSRGRGAFKGNDTRFDNNSARRGRKVRFSMGEDDAAAAADSKTSKNNSLPNIARSTKRSDAISAKPETNGVKPRMNVLQVQQSGGSFQDRYQNVNML